MIKYDFFSRWKYKHAAPVIYKRRGGQKIIFGVIFLIFVLYSFLLLAPIFMMFMNSLKQALEYNEQMFEGTAMYTFPKKISFENYSLAFKLMKVPTSNGDVLLLEMAWHSLWTSLFPSLISIYTQLCFAYVCARYDFFGKKFLYAFSLALMIIPVFGTTGTSLKLAMALGIYNKPIQMFVTAVSGFGMSMFILGSFFKGVSWEYAEAVFIDGGGHFTVFYKIMLPQARSIALVFFLSNFLAMYGDYTSRMLFMPDYVTIAVGLYFEQMILPREGNAPAYFAALFMSAIPILMFYIIFGKTFMTSMNIGGLKG